MQRFFRRFLSLVWGLFLYGLGVTLCIQANIGCAPWDTLHMGLAAKLGATVGQMSISIGAILCLLVFLLHEKLGLGTLFNMLLIGTFIDLIRASNIVPMIENFWIGIATMVSGLFIIAIGSYFYILSGFCAGPRDSLMVSVRRRTHFPVGVCRALVEGTVLAIGYFLGGQVGVGTIIAVFGIGLCVQIVFGLLRFDPAKIKHETLADTWANLTKRHKPGASSA